MGQAQLSFGTIGERNLLMGNWMLVTNEGKTKNSAEGANQSWNQKEGGGGPKPRVGWIGQGNSMTKKQLIC